MPTKDYRLRSDKISFEKYVEQQRAHLKFLNEEEQRIADAKKIVLGSILHARRSILKIDRQL